MSLISGPRRRRAARAVVAVVLTGALLVLIPGLALAHPLGNFTVNHFAGIRVEPERIVLDLVIDEAEIPTFQDRLRIDIDGDGVISSAEAEAERVAACPRLEPDLTLTVNGQRLAFVAFGAGLSFPPGTAGLSTMRLACEFTASLPDPGTAATITFDDASHAGRIGWHEVVVTGSGMTLSAGALPVTSISDRLRAYPANLIAHPLDVRQVTFKASPGGPVLPYLEPAEVTALTAPPSQPALQASPSAAAEPGSSAGATGQVAPTASPQPATGAVPGGVLGVDLAGLIGTSAITPFVLLTSLAGAFLLGAGHALTPGHGKTLMGAYLVGSRGSALQAVALGLSVTISHTLGIMVLAAIILEARDVAPELFNTVAPVVSGLAVVAIGAWLLIGQARRLRAHDHDHDHSHSHADDHGHSQQASQGGGPLGWRSLFAVGLAGGLIPSTNALIILLAAINVDRPAYGLVLVVAFGLGMAVILGGIGLGLVVVRDRLKHLPSGSKLGRLVGYAPLGAAGLIFVLGIWLTSQAIGVGPTF